MLRMTAQELAQASGLGVATVRRAEAAEREPSMTSANLRALRAALESAGIEFTNGEAPGVKLAKRT